jgi:hypothetical protein
VKHYWSDNKNEFEIGWECRTHGKENVLGNAAGKVPSGVNGS